MNWVRNAWVIGRLILVCVALFAVGMKAAKAATMAEANASCLAAAAERFGESAQYYDAGFCRAPTSYAPSVGVEGCSHNKATAAGHCWNVYFFPATACPAATPDFPYGTAGGACFNASAACQAVKARTENPSDGLYIAPNDERATIGASAGSSQCLGGCAWAPKPGEPSISVGSGATKVNWAQYAFTGSACAATVASPAPASAQVPVKPTAQVCIPPAGTSSGMCVRQDGKHCYAASTGRQICWNPGETGTKTDAAWMQKREPGTVPSPTPPPPPSGETLAQQGSPQTVSSTTTVNNSTSSTTTTTTNYSTTNGTNAGTTNQGSTTTGTGGAVVPGAGETGTETTTPGAVTIGNCTINYSCTNVSAVDCAILQETTKARCATEKNDMTRAMTGAEATAMTGEGANGAVDAEAAGILTDTEHGADGLDDSGFLSGSRSCPTIPPLDIMGQSFVMDTSAVCEWMTVGGYLVLLFGAIASLMVLKGS